MTAASFGFTCTPESSRRIHVVGEVRGLGFTVQSVGRASYDLDADPKDDKTYYANTVHTSVAVNHSTVQNTRGRFRKVGLVAPLVLR